MSSAWKLNIIEEKVLKSVCTVHICYTSRAEVNTPVMNSSESCEMIANHPQEEECLSETESKPVEQEAIL